ncbi:hypothetical protein OHA74_54740 [Streptomyces phaeochromogenes]|uniref:hypothetical protein n=1 Tax=Streptomyces phaeochromogenes TaxID=1923 RepID=UPI002E2970D4|nr:hypothetical protein [Streptomyces phaeochromogenes]
MANLPGQRRKHRPRPSRYAVELPARPSGLVISLPADYTAFCMLYQDRYLRYTRVRVADPGLSRTLVEAALGSVATNWATVLASHCPAAEAWNILGSLIAQAVRGHAATESCSTVYRVLPLLQADVVILRHRLSLSDQQAADLMGVEEPLVASQLRMAHRNMSRQLANPLP